jgi:hypothetical protein
MHRCWRAWGLSIALAGALRPGPAGAAEAQACPPEMARVADYCIDRWEASLVEEKSGGPRHLISAAASYRARARR